VSPPPLPGLPRLGARLADAGPERGALMAARGRPYPGRDPSKRPRAVQGRGHDPTESEVPMSEQNDSPQPSAEQIAALLRGAEPWLDKRGLAQHLSCSVRSIEAARAEGMPSAVIFGRRKFRVSEVEHWLEEHGYLDRHDGAGER
jgi:hypothetical protein